MSTPFFSTEQERLRAREAAIALNLDTWINLSDRPVPTPFQMEQMGLAFDRLYPPQPDAPKCYCNMDAPMPDRECPIHGDPTFTAPAPSFPFFPTEAERLRQMEILTDAAKDLAVMVGRASGNPDEGWGIWRDWLKLTMRRLYPPQPDAPDASVDDLNILERVLKPMHPSCTATPPEPSGLEKAQPCWIDMNHDTGICTVHLAKPVREFAHDVYPGWFVLSLAAPESTVPKDKAGWTFNVAPQNPPAPDAPEGEEGELIRFQANEHGDDMTFRFAHGPPLRFACDRVTVRKVVP